MDDPQTTTGKLRDVEILLQGLEGEDDANKPDPATLKVVVLEFI